RYVALAVLGACACSLFEDDARPDHDDDERCDEGTREACQGANGCRGVAVCSANGRLGRCSCDGGSNGGGGPAPGGGALRACCESAAFPAALRDGCLGLANLGQEVPCSSARGQYVASGSCGDTGSGGSTAGRGGAGGTVGNGGTTSDGGTTSSGGAST